MPTCAAEPAVQAGAPAPALFVCAWDRVVFIHYETDARILQRQVPFDLDLRDGKAYVSAVAFTLGGMRFARGGPALATHGFLNVRAYVRLGDERGIYFLSEWLPHPLCVLLGPRLYGLPYHLGRLDYRHFPERGSIRGTVAGASGRLSYHGSMAPDARFHLAEAGSLEEFLLERYAAFTERRGARRLFRVVHPPWLHAPAEVVVDDDSLVASSGPWHARARRIGAHYSPGLRRVGMGRPLKIEGEVP